MRRRARIARAMRAKRPMNVPMPDGDSAKPVAGVAAAAERSSGALYSFSVIVADGDVVCVSL